MRGSVAMVGLRHALDFEVERVERALTAAMRAVTNGLKEELRDQVLAAGLGHRLTRSWQGSTYPVSGMSLEPAAYIYSKAPKIISYFTSNQVVRAQGRRFLAIPTDDAPKGKGGARLTVEEAEARFGKRLVFVSPSDRGFRTPSMRRPGIAFLVVKDVVVKKATQRWRNIGPGERKRGRQSFSVILFILVPFVRSRKLLDLDGPAQRWAAAVPGMVETQLEGGA